MGQPRRSSRPLRAGAPGRWQKSCLLTVAHPTLKEGELCHGSFVAYIAVYVGLLGFASFLERPVGRGFGAFQLNILMRGGGVAVGVAALLVAHGMALPALPALLAGIGIGIITGIGSICYCLALAYLAVSVVVAFANLYIVVTVLLGMIVLHEAVTPLKIASLGVTLAGVLVLSYSPGRHGVQPGEGAATETHWLRPLANLAAYILLVGTGAFLEKPGLQGLDATQLNALQAAGLAVVACVALIVRRDSVSPDRADLGALMVGMMIGLGSIFYFLGLERLPVSIAAAASNGYMVATVLLSVLLQHEALGWPKRTGIALTVVGVTLLAYSGH